MGKEFSPQGSEDKQAIGFRALTSAPCPPKISCLVLSPPIPQLS